MALAVETGNCLPRGDRAGAERLAGLDLLRLLAALAVVGFHYAYAGPARGLGSAAFPEIAGLARYGFLGVDLFFVISGLVIACSVEGRSWHAFARARLLRLYPAHVVCMTLTALVLVTLGSATSPVGLAQWAANLTMVAPALGQPFMDGVYWSIVIELVFYGWVALLTAAGVWQRRLLTIMALWLAMAVLNELVLQQRVLRIALCSEYAGLLASGVLMAQIWRGRNGPAQWLLLGAAIAHGATHHLESLRLFERLYADALGLDTLLLLHLGIYALVAAGLWVSRHLPARQWVLTLGGLTYPLYLIHQDAGHVVIGLLAPALGRWGAATTALGLSMLTAWLVYRFAEPVGRRWLAAAIDAAARVRGLSAGGLRGPLHRVRRTLP